MKRSPFWSVLGLLSLLIQTGEPLSAQAGRPVASPAGPVTEWPRPIPIRLKPEGRDDLLITTLGQVTTSLADGMFDPTLDRVNTNDGRVLEHYYRDHLGVPFYQPIDKSVFPLPPSGWCTWYYYYQEITPEEVIANARWIRRHLAPFGARYVQIDDGWQGTGHGLGENRDWTTIDRRFRGLGMARLADSIRALGLEAGLWIAPHGQSNEQVVRSTGAFILKPDGSSASSTWVGRYLVDPSSDAGLHYLSQLFARLRSYGYSYFKIDGQPIVVDEYSARQSFMKGPIGAGNPREVGSRLFRETLATIRQAIGPSSYLLASWGTAAEGVGFFHGSRTGGDIVPGWDGFLTAAGAVQEWNFLHNIGWYSDPDVLLVRPPLTEGTARSWSTMYGLTGQSLMSSDRLTDLPASRVELLKRVFPATDIRPLDLFRSDNALKQIVDLKVHQLGRSYDVVGIFNYDPEHATTRLISWSELGLDSTAEYHVYDFWNGTYLGSWNKGVFAEIPAGDVRVLTLVPATARPVLLSTSRHITQGWVDLVDLRAGGNDRRPILSGRSHVVGGDPYTLTIGLPRGAPTFRLASGIATGSRHPVHLTWESHQGYATATIASDQSQDVSWSLSFEPAQPYHYPVVSPADLQLVPIGISSTELRWPNEYHGRGGYLISLNGTPLGVAFESRVEFHGLTPGQPYRFMVQSLWYDGTVSDSGAEVTWTPAVPAEAYLSDFDPLVARQGWGSLGRDRSVEGKPLSVAGVVHARGLGTHAASDLRYQIFGAFERFAGLAGIDDEVQPDRRVEAFFEVWGDGRLLWSSGLVRKGDQPVRFDLDVRGIHELQLKVLPGSDGIDWDHADWLDPRLTSGR